MTGHHVTVTGVGVSHRRVAVSELEAASWPDPTARLETLLDREDVDEAFLLQTCHRVEEYVVTPEPSSGAAAVDDFATGVSSEAIESMGHRGSLRHLLRVAAGLDSQVIGEDEILGQVKRAYRLADGIGALGEILDPAVLKAIHVGERARTETAINEGNVSLGSAAVELADGELGVDGRDVLLVGAGGIAKTVASRVADHGPSSLAIANRSLSNAEALAADLSIPATAVGLRDLPKRASMSDLVFTATGSDDPVLARRDLAGSDGTLVVDLGQPRDVDGGVESIPGITVRDLDDLRTVVDSSVSERAEAADSVEEIVDEELDLLLDQHKRARADAVIAGMYRGAEYIKRREVDSALSKLETDGAVTPQEREVVEGLADTLVSQLLAIPTRSLREAALEDDWETITSAIQLFDPDVDGQMAFFVRPDEKSAIDAGGED